MKKYKTAPVASSALSPGTPFIVVNEAAERFSYYGMRAILVVFMTQYLMDSQGQLDALPLYGLLIGDYIRPNH